MDVSAESGKEMRIQLEARRFHKSPRPVRRYREPTAFTMHVVIRHMMCRPAAYGLALQVLPASSSLWLLAAFSPLPNLQSGCPWRRWFNGPLAFYGHFLVSISKARSAGSLVGYISSRLVAYRFHPRNLLTLPGVRMMILPLT